MKQDNDRRQHIRLQREDKLFIQVIAASESPQLVGETLSCTAVDISASGLKITLHDEVPIGSEIDLWVDIRSCAAKYFLNGLVKWCYEADAGDNSYQIGVELLNMPYTDFINWQYLFIGVESLSHIGPR